VELASGILRRFLSLISQVRTPTRHRATPMRVIAMKQFNLIGRIHEKLGKGPGPERLPLAEAGTRTRDAEIRHQADWLLETIRHTSEEFLSLAAGSGLRPGTRASTGDMGDEPGVHSLLLGYKLTLTVWRRRHEKPDRDVLGRVRLGMIRELRHLDTPTPDEHLQDRRRLPETGADPYLPEEHPRVQAIGRVYLDPADSDIAASVIRFEAGLPGPLSPFFGGLAPAFGGPCATDELPARYGKIVRHLYDTIEKKLDEWERARAGRSGLTRYAGAGH